MKRKIKRIACLVLALVLFCSVVPNFVCARNYTQDLRNMADRVIDSQISSGDFDSVEEWIGEGLCANIDVGGEWYVIALAQFCDVDLSSYESALIEYLSENKIYSEASRQKYALCLSSLGSTNAYISSVVNDLSENTGIMSLAFGLHLLNNGYKCEGYGIFNAKKAILSRICDDGGWSVSGGKSDVDVTAMVIQALAPHVAEDKEVADAIDSALDFLSEKQLDSGGFESYGAENAESCAQVLIALSSLGIDFRSDARFIKNGNTILDALEDFRISDGSFSHTRDDMKFSSGATAQVLCALVSCVRLQEGKDPFYILDRARAQEVEKDLSINVDDTSSGDEENFSGIDEKKGGYKVWICLGVTVVGVLVAILLFVFKKTHIKNFIALAVVLAAVILAVCFTNIESADSYYGKELPKKEDPIGSVTITVRCDTVAGKKDNIPSDGVIIRETVVKIEEGESVYDILVQVSKLYSVRLDSQFGSSSAYITGISDLYQFDFGDLSGWVCFVNGKGISVGASEYKLSDGDVIEWHYTCSLGEDLPKYK